MRRRDQEGEGGEEEKRMKKSLGTALQEESV